MRYCHSCGQTLDEKMEIFRSTVCPSCGKDLRVCLNCRFYSPGVHWDCGETIEEPVRDKDRANFCSYFSFAERKVQGGVSGSSRGGAGDPAKTQAREAFDRLFGDG